MTEATSRPGRTSPARQEWRQIGELIWLAAHIHSCSTMARPDPERISADDPQAGGDLHQNSDRPPGSQTSASGDLPREANETTNSTINVVTLAGPGATTWTPITAAQGKQSRSITRAARTLLRTVPTTHEPLRMDEVATAERAARDGLWLPVLAQAEEPLVDVDIVVDEGPFPEFQQEQAWRIAAAIAASYAFRRCRVNLLETAHHQAAGLLLRPPGPLSKQIPAGRLTHPRNTSRRLIIVLTNGMAHAWHSRAAHRLLARWGTGSAVAIIHSLPARLWQRTGVDASRTVVRTPLRVSPNAKYEPSRIGEVLVPVLEADSTQIKAWAELVAGVRTRWDGAAITCSLDQATPSSGEVDHSLSVEQRVRRFHAETTPAAFTLATLLAAAPLSPAIVNLIQRTLLPRTTDAELAEVLGSDLVHRTHEGGRTLLIAGDVRYDFIPGVRQALLSAGRRSDTAQVVVTVADLLGQEVDALRRLRDVVIAPADAALPDLPEDLYPLLDPAVSALEAMAGPYMKPARQLRNAILTTNESLAGMDRTGTGWARIIRLARSTPESNVYRHVARNPPPADTFGGSVDMSAVPIPPRRDAFEPVPVWNVPQKNLNFTGRSDLLTLLHQRLSTGTTAVLPEALHGLGGVGKSQIAIEYCYRHQDDYDLIWWIPSERLTMVRQAFVDLAVHLKLNMTEPNMAVPAVKEALRLGRPYANWLLVFDNAEDVDEIRQFFPTNGPGKIMITSRSREWFSHAAPLEVDVFKREESRQLLRIRGPELSDHDADELSERLGDLPLAIEQAAVWLSETGMPISEYLQLFDEKRQELLSVEGAEIPVAAAWNVSFDRLRESHPAALQLLQVCAFFAPEPIPRSLLTRTRDLEGPPELLDALADPIELSRTIRAINQYALAKLNHRDNTISLHRLVQRVVTSQLSKEEAETLRHCGHMLLTNANPKEPGNLTRWPDYQALFPHVLASGLVNCHDAWAGRLVLDLIDYLFTWGDTDGFKALAQQAVETWTAALGADHDATLAAELRLGRALRIFADFPEAYRHHLHVRDSLQARLGPDHERTLEAVGYLGADLRYLGKFAEAVEIDQQAFETLRRRFGSDDPLTLQQAHLLGIDWRLNGEPARARELDLDTLRRKADMYGPDHLSTSSTRAALIIDEMECGRYLEAYRLQKQHVEVMRRTYQNSHPGTMDAIALMSVMACKAGHHQEALNLSREALALFSARYGEQYQATVGVSLIHAVNLRNIGDFESSVELGAAAREAYEQIFGPQHPNTPAASVNLAVSLRLIDRVQAARDIDSEALRMLTESLSPDHPHTLVCAVNLASDLFTLGDLVPAHEQDRRTLEQLRRVLGDSHPTTLACAQNLCLDMKVLEQEDDALFQDTIAKLVETLGANHPAVQAAKQGKRANCDIHPIPL
ncbi:FxSxx-COOH system tetratricopeptide repeat protein [Sphaerisporangium aureirubrum]|uniref:FxSxx-COOH system tetratricopeptide repeat protein n=1 Tax=Sphaerisporangium aureirubrum TaxID=1544736 RepID=A0ABW1NNW0_9ACTN